MTSVKGGPGGGPDRSAVASARDTTLSGTADSPLIGIVGLGYVGLPTALSLVKAGCTVIGCDISESRLAAIKSQRVDLLLADQVRLDACLDSSRFTLTTEVSGLSRADAVMVCVPTPVDAHLVPDLRALASACESVVANAVPGQTIVLTSTTYIGCTNDLLVEPLRCRGLEVGRDVFVAFSPERIDPGVVEHHPERTPRVVGGITPACAERAARVLGRTAASLHMVSSAEVAEMAKLLENTFRAVNIALANEFAEVARRFNIDPVEVVAAAATKPYGFMPFYPGPGAGGHCIPCDPHYLLWQLRALRASSPVIEAAMSSIAARPQVVINRAREVLAEDGQGLAGASVLVVGVAYKPGVADVRESPALEILAGLRRAGARVSYTDALVDSLQTPGGELINEPMPARKQWDLVIVHTLHPTADHTWIADLPLVLDATYRLPGVTHRALL